VQWIFMVAFAFRLRAWGLHPSTMPIMPISAPA
jgi:hypothetical protein